MSNFSVQEILQEIERQAPVVGVDPALAKAIFSAENSKTGKLERTHVLGATTSHAGARGVMQTMPQTEEALKQAGFLPTTWSFNPSDLKGQVQAGLAAIREMQTRQKDKNDPLELAAMYNGGTQAWKDYRAGLLDRLPAETRGYFEKVKTALGGGMATSNQQMTPQQIERAAASQPPSGGSTLSGSRTSQSTRSTSYDAERLAAAMSQGISIIQEGGAADTAIATIESARAQQQAAQQAQMIAVTAMGQAAGQAATTKAAVEAAGAARRAEILRTASINPEQAGNLATQSMEEIIQGTSRLEALGAEIDQRMAVGFFDNPLEWLVNQTRLPGMVGQYNAGARQINRKIDATKNLQELAATQISLSTATDADLIAEAGAAEAARSAAEAQAKLEEIKAAQAGTAIRDAQTALVIAGQKFQTAVTMAELTKQVKSESAAMSEREASQRAEQIALERVNRWLKMIGSNMQYDTASFKSIPSKQREELFALSSTERIAPDLNTALQVIDRYGNYQKIAAEGDAGAITWIRNTAARAQQMATEDLKLAEQQSKITGKPVKREEFIALSLDKLQQLYQVEANDMRTASPDNPIRINYDMMLKDPALQNNGVNKIVREFGPTAPNPLMARVDEKIILDKFAADVATGKMPVSQAASEISNFYKTGSDLQARRTKYPLFGIDKPANGYTVVIPKPGIFELGVGTAGGTVDLTNQAAVEAYLIKDVAVKARANTPAGPYRPFFDPLGLSKSPSP